MSTKLIVGLGNPGKKYQDTRHNIGFIVLELLYKFYTGQKFSPSKKFEGLFSESHTNGHKILWIEPQTYMNLSGTCVQSVANFYTIAIENILVLHDEIDFPTAQIKYKVGGGAAGHNGLKDIIKKLGPDFRRIRIGVDRPIHNAMSVADYVLSNLTNVELDEISSKFDLIQGYVDQFLQEV